MTIFFQDPRSYGAGRSADAVTGALGVDPGRLLKAARQPRAGMFAGRLPIDRNRSSGIAHSPEELRREQLACLAPVFGGMLGDPDVQRNIDAAMASAIATPNRGKYGDIPANGSEFGFLAAKFPLLGTRMGPITTNWREREMDFDSDNAPFPAPFLTPHDLTAIHVHQSTGAPGLSHQDLTVADTTDAGPGMNIVAVDRDGRRYCRVAQR